MPDWSVISAILAVGAASYAMRAGGFLTAGTLRHDSLPARLLRLAPGNLCVAFGAAGVLEGGLPYLAGCAAAVAAMAIAEREWAALGAGFAAAALAASVV